MEVFFWNDQRINSSRIKIVANANKRSPIPTPNIWNGTFLDFFENTETIRAIKPMDIIKLAKTAENINK